MRLVGVREFLRQSRPVALLRDGVVLRLRNAVRQQQQVGRGRIGQQEHVDAKARIGKFLLLEIQVRGLVDRLGISRVGAQRAREALRGVIVEAFAPLTAAQVIERLEAAGIANAQMNTLNDVWVHPQLAARERWQEVGTPAGMIPALLPPGLPTSFEPRMDPVPALGEHTDAILSELGYEPERIQALRAAGII